MGVVAPLPRFLALLPFGDHHPAFGHEAVVELVGVGWQHVFVQADGGIGAFGELGVQRQDLVVAGEEGLIETLVVGIALLDVAEMPLAVERGVVAGLRQHLGHGDLFAAHAMALQQHADVVHAVADRMPSGDDGGAARRAADFGVHAREQNAFFRQPVEVRCGQAAHFLDRGNADVSEGRVVPHDVDEVWRAAMLFL